MTHAHPRSAHTDHEPTGPHGDTAHTAHTHEPHTHEPHAHEPHAHDQAEILDLDAEVLAEHTASVTAWLPVTDAPRHIVDLGCGTGAGTLALLDRFPGARVTAVDTSPAHLERLREKAAAIGAAERVRLVHADLDAPQWPALGTPGLVWASASLHHLADPGRTLARVRELLAPGGLFAVVELAGFPRFLPPDAPAEAPGLEERCHAALDRHHARELPHRGADWGPLLTAAGFTVEGERTVAVDIGPSRDETVVRYALQGLRRLRDGAATALTAGDLAALDALLDADGPRGIPGRGDVGVRTERTVWAARRT
ncbi:class I SAM-dependent methyltransferase [Streptomyces genisteinicus]|uniref:Methyltransferase domain-containing protein n=1 Tax=Streptomyces genisteinicus TaxID=2768068 RepID=A0A7H0HLZ7_9ACTN|nr:class I SAM-dependent methyltransferase [Streptomyces genisteinicus]QNP61563.1 methyltransferase domain-containing protein [Streptomyces genisteinicus]